MSSSYYPKKYSEYIDYLEMAENKLLKDPSYEDEEVIGQNLRYTTTNPDPIDTRLGDYVKKVRKRISGHKYLDGRKEEDAYRVRYRKKYYYVAHYDSIKYQKDMILYKNGKRKSRPNGRTWCKFPKGIDPIR